MGARNIEELHYKMLEQYAPPSIVVNESYDIIHMSQRADKYLEIPAGAPTKNLLKLIRSQIKSVLQKALSQALQNTRPIEVKNVKLTLDDQTQIIDIHVRPIVENDVVMGPLLVILKPIERSSEELSNIPHHIPQHTPFPEMLSEKLEISNDEFRVMNEALRCAAEELETNKEELQSINEELRTVNQELKAKIEETSISNNNLENLINSANVSTIFLDKTFSIRLFTPAILEIFNLQTSDYGRPITDITHKLEYDDLISDATTVLENLEPIEREVKTIDNRIFMLQLLPYRTAENHVNGIVITFFDITKRKEAENILRSSEEKYRKELEQEVESRTADLKENRDLLQSILDNSFIGMMVFQPIRNESEKIVDFVIKLANLEINRETGRTDLVGKHYFEEYPRAEKIGLFEIMLRVMETGKSEGLEYCYSLEGFNKWYSCSFVKMGDCLVGTNLNTTERNAAEEQLRKSNEQMRMFFIASSDLIYQMNADWSQMISMESYKFLLSASIPAENWMANYIPEDERNTIQKTIDSATLEKKVFELEHRILLENGQVGWVHSKAVPLFDSEGEIIEWFGVASNITVRKSYETEYHKNYLLLHQSEEVGGTGTWDYSLSDKTISWSDGMYRLFELDKGADIGPEIYLKYALAEHRDIASRITNAIRKGAAAFEESVTVKVGEKLKVIKTKATMVYDEKGYPIRVLGVDMDVTVSTLAEERLRQLEAEQQLEIFRVTLNTQEEERRRISESLHNGLAQLLFGIKISMNSLSPDLARQDIKAYESSRKYTEKLLTNAIAESRRISHELMPVLLDEFGLNVAITDISDQVKPAVNFSCSVLLGGIVLEKYFELAVYRIIQELVVNVVKHAEATAGKIEVAVKGQEIMIRVTDNGKGLDESRPSAAGIGLTSIRNKANALNGRFKFTSHPDKGTVVEVWLVIDTYKSSDRFK